MKNKVYHTQLEDLQELREQATGLEKKEIQKKIDALFFSNPKKHKQKKKKVRIPKDPDDMWY